MRSFKLNKRNAGFSLLEVLITLSVLALIIAVIGGQSSEPSAALRLANLASQLKSDLAAHRARAVIERNAIVFNIQQDTCEGPPSTITLYSDGTALGNDVCLQIDGNQLVMRIDPMTAQLHEVATP